MVINRERGFYEAVKQTEKFMAFLSGGMMVARWMEGGMRSK